MKRFQQSWNRQQTKQGLFGAHVDKDRNKYRPIPVLLPCLFKFIKRLKLLQTLLRLIKYFTLDFSLYFLNNNFLN